MDLPGMGADGHQLVAPLQQIGGKLAKLTRKVLVDQQKPHGKA
jgi:hypothetical protein